MSNGQPKFYLLRADALPEVFVKVIEAKELLDGGGLDRDFREMVQEQLEESRELAEQLVEELKILLLPKDPNDVHAYGFNVSYEAHKHWAYWFEKADEMEARTRGLHRHAVHLLRL